MLGRFPWNLSAPLGQKMDGVRELELFLVFAIVSQEYISTSFKLQFKTFYLTQMSCCLYIFLSSTLKNKAKVLLPSEFLILNISLDRSPSFILAKKNPQLSLSKPSSDSKLKLDRLSAKYKTLELWLFLSFAKSWIDHPHSIPPHPHQQIFSNRLSEDLSI